MLDSQALIKVPNIHACAHADAGADPDSRANPDAGSEPDSRNNAYSISIPDANAHEDAHSHAGSDADTTTDADAAANPDTPAGSVSATERRPVLSPFPKGHFLDTILARAGRRALRGSELGPTFLATETTAAERLLNCCK